MLIITYENFRSDNDSIQLNRSTEIALLWSSGGTKSILLNQWQSTMNENESVLINTFTGNKICLIILINNSIFIQILQLFIVHLVKHYVFMFIHIFVQLKLIQQQQKTQKLKEMLLRIKKLDLHLRRANNGNHQLL
jgi:hypothetical protein